MYFPNAFRKSFLPVPVNGDLTPVSAGTTATLTAGQIGFFDPKTYAATTMASAAPFIIAQGSYFAADKIGPVHGGYKESVKSKVINPKYVSRIIKVAADSPVNQKVAVSISNMTTENTYRLRLDLKGSPALRFLNHQLYKTLDAFTGYGTVGALVDPTTVAIAWAKQIQESPIFKDFLSVVVKDTTNAAVANLDTFAAAGGITGASTATLEITVAYIDTKFGTATFTPTDFVEKAPLFIYASAVAESGDPAEVVGVTVTELVAAKQASGLGETVLRDLILDGRYLQNAYPDSTRVDSLRMREIEADPALATVDRNGLYDQVLILHNVPRFNNPSSTFDNDQYLIVVHVPAGTDVDAFVSFITSSTSQAGNIVPVETV